VATILFLIFLILFLISLVRHVSTRACSLKDRSERREDKLPKSERASGVRPLAPDQIASFLGAIRRQL
jgi:hypothetical protein